MSTNLVEALGEAQAAHLVNFMGTDTVAALLCTKKYYHAKILGFDIDTETCFFGGK